MRVASLCAACLDADDRNSVTSQYMWPFNEDLIRFDFETDGDVLGHSEHCIHGPINS